MSKSVAPTVTLAPKALEIIEEHCFSRVDVEVGGFLLGRIEGSKTEVLDAKPALSATSAQTHLTITHEAWNDILAVLDTQFAGMAIVGWYHTHPGFGLFLSDYDIFIQANFFPSAGQFALVVDPLIGEYAMFVAEGESAHRFGGAATTRAAVANPAQDAGEARAMLLTGTSTNRSRGGRRWVPAVIAIALTAVVVGSSAWFIGVTQGQDTAGRAGQEKVTSLSDQVANLESQLAQATASLQAAPLLTETPAPVPSTTSVPAGPQGGDPVRITIRHIVRPGESWWSIAERYLGAGRRYPEIQAVNPGQQGLDAGDEIAVPLSGSYLAQDEGATQ